MSEKGKMIPISNQTDGRLKRLARPLDDSYDSVIARLLDAYEQAAQPDCASETEILRKERVFDPFQHPSLTHTKVTFASFDGEPLRKPNWNSLLDHALLTLRGKEMSVGAIKRLTKVNIIDGKKTDEGYRYLVDAELSVQGQDANDAWGAVAQLATRTARPVEVHFFWRHKDGAALPGDKGMFKIVERNIETVFEKLVTGDAQ